MWYSSAAGWVKSLLTWIASQGVVLFSWLRSVLWLVDLAVLSAMAFVLVHGRWLSIVYPYPLNPDEAQAAANALRIKAYGFNWDVLDGATNGPLDSLIVCWPHLFGWDVTLSTVHLTACALIFLACLFVYLSIKILCGRGFAIALVLPLVLFYSFTENRNFLHQSSELLPVALLVAADYLAIRLSLDRTQPRRFRYLVFALLGILLGAVPFAKIQGAPIAVVIGLYAFILAVTDPFKGRLRNSIALICGGLAPAFCFLLPLFVSGHIQDFWRSYITWAFLYVQEPLSFADVFGMLSAELMLRYTTYFTFMLGLVSLLHVYIATPDRDDAGRSGRYDIVYGLVLVVAAFWVIAKPGNDFAHYLMFFPPFGAMFCAYIVRAFAGQRKHALLFAGYYVVLAAVCFALYRANDTKDYERKYSDARFESLLHLPFEVKSPHLLSWLPIPAKHLLVWGWMPQWYVWSGLTPSSRETNTYAEITDSTLQGYFRSRFMSDIGSAPPDIIMDAVEQGSFYFNRPSKFGPQAFPEFSAYLSSDYTQLTPWQPHDGCPKLYVRNEYKEVIDRRLILPASVTTSADLLGEKSPFNGANLFDNSVTEDSCADYWLLPTRTLGSVDVKFQKIEPVSSLMILNTRNGGYIDRAADRIDVKLLKSGAVMSDRQLAMQPYPYWTSIDLDEPVQADELQVSILSFFGRGGGLNEIKIFRPDESAVGDSGTASHHP